MNIFDIHSNITAAYEEYIRSEANRNIKKTLAN
jgi:hypothetical protein